jgi:hypothetical protein
MPGTIQLDNLKFTDGDVLTADSLRLIVSKLQELDLYMAKDKRQRTSDDPL